MAGIVKIRLTFSRKVDMAKPTKDDKARRRAVKAARKVDKERAKQTRQENEGKEAFGQAAAGARETRPSTNNARCFCDDFQFHFRLHFNCSQYLRLRRIR
jgi:hypothetical protein